MRQIGRSSWVIIRHPTDRQTRLKQSAHILCGTSNNPKQGFFGWSKFQKLISLQQNFIFIKFLKSTIFFHKSRELFFLLFYNVCIQRKNVHNWNIRWARSALNGCKYCMTGQKMKKPHKITIHLNLSNIKIKESNYLLKIPPKVRL